MTKIPAPARLRYLGLPLLLGSLVLGACGAKGGATGDGTGDPSAVTQGEQGAPGARLPFLQAVLRLDDLSADQRAKVLTIADEYEAAIAPRRVAGSALAELFAKSLEAGKMDDAAIDAKLKELETLAVAEKTALAAALDGMHEVLTPSQRTALVDSIANRHHGQHGQHGQHGKDGKGPFGKHEHDGKNGGLPGPLRHLVGDLDLTDAQREAFETKLSSEGKPVWDHAANMANLKAMGDAFKTGEFSAKSHDLALLGGPSPATFATKMRRVIAVSIEVLDAGQRAKMAAKIRDFAAKMG